jgi:trans-aconitate methyltransferase
MEHVNSWKNKEVFVDQLALNESELNNYPDHWKHFLNATLKCVSIRKSTLLDIGCGAGTYKTICESHLPNVTYTGMDYSQEAIEIAKTRWGGVNWRVGDYQSLTEQDGAQYDILHAGAMLDVLPKGDEALSFLLSLGFKNIILGRVKLTEDDSNCSVYEVYNKIQTYAYSHNIPNLLRMFKEAQYACTLIQGEQNSCTILLQKNQSH